MTDNELRELVASLAIAQKKTDAQLVKTDAQLAKTDAQLAEFQKKSEARFERLEKGFEDMQKGFKQLPKFKQEHPAFANHKLYGAVGSLIFPEQLEQQAAGEGLFVFIQTKDGASIVNPADFRAKEF